MACGCPAGYTYNQTTGLCEDMVRVPAVINTNAVLPVKIQHDNLNMCYGTAVYSPLNPNLFPIVGRIEGEISFVASNNSVIHPAAFISAGKLWISDDVATNGRLNQAGVGLMPPIGNWQGYSVCIDVQQAEQYAVAVSSIYGFRVYVDGVLAIFYLPSLPSRASDYLHVFPILLTEGPHIILCEGLCGALMETRMCTDIYGVAVDCVNSSAVHPPNSAPNLGAFVFEMYKNITPQILSDASNQADLNSLYAKITLNGIGQYVTTLLLSGNPTDTGENGKYTQGEGYLNKCLNDQVVFQHLDTIPYVPCCFNLINCKTGAHIVTNSDMSIYMNKVVKIMGHSECFIIGINSEEPCSGSPVTVTDYYDNCAVCTKKYYTLVDCNGIATSIITDSDLSDYVSKSIKISGYSNVCWIVVESGQTEETTDVEVVGSFDTCEDCS